jgi:hypothetical protein
MATPAPVSLHTAPKGPGPLRPSLLVHFGTSAAIAKSDNQIPVPSDSQNDRKFSKHISLYAIDLIRSIKQRQKHLAPIGKHSV